MKISLRCAAFALLLAAAAASSAARAQEEPAGHPAPLLLLAPKIGIWVPTSCSACSRST